MVSSCAGAEQPGQVPGATVRRRALPYVTSWPPVRQMRLTRNQRVYGGRQLVGVTQVRLREGQVIGVRQAPTSGHQGDVQALGQVVGALGPYAALSGLST